MVVLWTDSLIFTLILAVFGIVIYLRGKAHIKRPLQKIARNKVGMVSLVILLIFVQIGFLDSIHFKSADSKSNEIISLLDYWATPLREHVEKTYSAPFATTLYSKEIILLPDGTSQWGYPRLEFGGRYLDNPETQYLSDVLQKTGYGLLQGITLAGLLLVVFFGVRYALKSNKSQVFALSPSLNSVVTVIFIIVSISYTIIYLSAFYHVLGTDKVGEDVFYQAVKSIRTGLVLGTLTTLIMLPMAIIFGILAGFFRGWIDDLIQYVYTTLNSIPSVLLIAASILMVQVYMANHQQDFTSVIVRADMRLLFLCLILGLTNRA